MEKVYKPCEYPNEYRNNFKSSCAQLYAGAVECFFLVSLGMQFVMPTVVLGALHNKAGDVMSLDDEAASWIGSILYICQPLGAVVSGYMSEKFGRKGAMMLVNGPFFAGWILLYYSTSVRGLFIATFTSGLGMGFCEAPVANYLGEISEPRWRGVLISMTTAACLLGSMLELLISAVLDWRTTALVSSSLPVISLIFFITIPESPVWLITKNRMDKAQKSLAWLRGFLQPHQVKKEFDALVRYTNHSVHLDENGTEEENVPLDSKHKAVEEKPKGWFREVIDELKNPKIYLPLRLIFILFFFTQCAALIPFRSYLVEIFNNFNFPIDSKWVLVMTSVTSFIGSAGTIFVVKWAGKRRLAIYSMFTTTLTILIMGLFSTFFKNTKHELWSWLLTINVGACFLFSSLGVISIGWMFLCEIFPVKARAMATGLSMAWSYCVSFTLTKTYIQSQHLIGLDGMFYVYAAISFIGYLYFVFYLPETEGKPLETIETFWTPNHDKKAKFSLPKKNKNASKA